MTKLIYWLKIRQTHTESNSNERAKSYRQGEDWNGNKVYIPVYSKTAFVGLPLVIFEDEKGLRLSTPEEAVDYINKTTVFD